MSRFSYDLAERYVEHCQRELGEMFDRKGVIVIDNSFVNGFLQRRMFRDEFYPTLDEAFYAEALFQNGFYKNLPDNVVFPKQMRQEHADGVERLVKLLDDPEGALVHRWGGRPGEPAKSTYKVIGCEYDLEEDVFDKARKNLVELIRALQFGSSIQRVMPAEAHLYGNRNQAVIHSGRQRLLGKSYNSPEAVKFHGHLRRDMSDFCLASGFHEIPSRPISAVRPSSKNADNDIDMFHTSLKISQFGPVTLATSDGDLKTVHREHYSLRREEKYGVTVLHDGHDYTQTLQPKLVS